MSRLLTLLMIYRVGYIVGKYISIERLIEKTKESYYERLHESSLNWHEEENNYIPFDVCRITVERALSGLLSSESIIKIGGRRYTKYVWDRDKE